MTSEAEEMTKSRGRLGTALEAGLGGLDVGWGVLDQWFQRSAHSLWRHLAFIWGCVYLAQQLDTLRLSLEHYATHRMRRIGAEALAGQYPSRQCCSVLVSVGRVVGAERGRVARQSGRSRRPHLPGYLDSSAPCEVMTAQVVIL